MAKSTCVHCGTTIRQSCRGWLDDDAFANCKVPHAPETPEVQSTWAGVPAPWDLPWPSIDDIWPRNTGSKSATVGLVEMLFAVAVWSVMVVIMACIYAYIYIAAAITRKPTGMDEDK